jgi:UDP-N-acetylmuramyl pentapeptide phosphotransferase/UDP-N-acetylglucosamine-1-phosphate transferase
VNSILFIIFQVLLIFILNKIFIQKNFLIDQKKLIHKSFTSSDLVPITGGFLIIINMLFVNNNYLSNIFFLIIFLFGILSDSLVIENPEKKLFLQFFIVIFFLLSLNISIISTKVFFIDFFIENKIFGILFTAFCLLVLINGSNFLDGVNTLVCGYYILVVSVVLYIGHYNTINYNFLDYYYLLLSLLVIFIFNFFSKTYLGDSGTFLLSFVIGYYLINLCNNNLYLIKYISPIFVLLLLWYPAFENLFSIVRKILSKKRPSEPDNFHLHHLFFNYLKQTIKNKKIANNFSGIIINFYNLLVFLLAANFYNQTNFLSFLIAINIFVYIIFYYFLLKKNKQISFLFKSSA